MPIFLKPENVLDLGSDRVVDEISDEVFDRAAFARHAIDLLQPPRTTIAICEGASRLRVESGRQWGRSRTTSSGATDGPPDRWALLAIPHYASRRAIALAIAQLAQRPRAYALDVLMGEVDDEATPSEPNAA
jgi:hypothetical protein